MSEEKKAKQKDPFEEVVDLVLPKETQKHLLAAGSEFLLALKSFIDAKTSLENQEKHGKKKVIRIEVE